jgi:hypothetical protein
MVPQVVSKLIRDVPRDPRQTKQLAVAEIQLAHLGSAQSCRQFHYGVEDLIRVRPCPSERHEDLATGPQLLTRVTQLPALLDGANGVR